MIRILETTYKIEANRYEFDVLKKVLSLAVESSFILENLEEWQQRLLGNIVTELNFPPQKDSV